MYFILSASYVLYEHKTFLCNTMIYLIFSIFVHYREEHKRILVQLEKQKLIW